MRDTWFIGMVQWLLLGHFSSVYFRSDTLIKSPLNSNQIFTTNIGEQMF